MTWVWFLLLLAALATYGGLRSTQSADPCPIARRPLLLVPLTAPGDQPVQPLLDWAAEVLRLELGLQVALHPEPLSLPANTLHPQRGQGDAVALVGLVESLVTPELAVLALTEYDLHSPLRRDLPYAMGARKGWAGLISTYRMEDKKDPANTTERLRKMLIRYGAEIACDAPRERDPRSVLYDSLQRAEQLDLMEWPPE